MKVKKILVLSLEEARTQIAKVHARDLAERPEALLHDLLNGGILETTRIPAEIAQVFVDGDLGAELAGGAGADAVAIEFGNPEAVEMEMDKLTMVWVENDSVKEEYCSNCQKAHWGECSAAASSSSGRGPGHVTGDI